jgi:hypothetical protein
MKQRKIDEYFLTKLEIAENIAKFKELENKELLEKIKELENKTKTKGEDDKVVEGAFKCYLVFPVRHYFIDSFNKKYNNLGFMKKCLEDGEAIKEFLNCGRETPYIVEKTYDYQIDYFGTTVGICLFNDFQADGRIRSYLYVIDNVEICESMEKAQEQLIISQREEIEYYIKNTLTRNEAK